MVTGHARKVPPAATEHASGPRAAPGGALRGRAGDEREARPAQGKPGPTCRRQGWGLPGRRSPGRQWAVDKRRRGDPGWGDPRREGRAFGRQLGGGHRAPRPQRGAVAVGGRSRRRRGRAAPAAHPLHCWPARRAPLPRSKSVQDMLHFAVALWLGKAVASGSRTLMRSQPICFTGGPKGARPLWLRAFSQRPLAR